MDTIFNPLIQNVNQSYQQLATQMNRIDDCFGAPPMQISPLVQPQVVRKVRNEGVVLEENTVNQGQKIVPQVVEQEIPREVECPPTIMVNRNHVVDQFVHQVRQGNMLGENNLATIVKWIMAQNSVNMGLQRPNHTSPLSEYVLQTELPRGWKVPKFTKFAGDTNESTIMHIT
ncbi:uncharacterized protein LOC127136417 [Lathyrus oleraceus]|uniref:uncharacterized protein LOC127136417 n=1 Tax=Pisum sativum TaxID=3888 RepID=UPI0021D0647F|nr:uncharacterized protein LOC127136417 [Pisum sativum]